MNYLQRAAKEAAEAARIDPYYARWEKVPSLQGEALVFHLPWARLVVARSVGGVARFVELYQAGKCSWLQDSLEAQYPIERLGPLYPERFMEAPIFDKNLAGFVRWGVKVRGTAAWPITSHTCVIGSWSSYRDAVLVRARDGRMTLRQRDLRSAHGKPHSKSGQPSATKLDQLDRERPRSRRRVPPVA